MASDLQRTKSSLIQRGVELGTSNAPYKIDRLATDLNVSFGSGFRSVYMMFDGFSNYDPLSYLRLWSLDEIKQNQPIYTHGLVHLGSRWLVVGDFLMESDLIIAEIEQESSTVKLLDDDRIGLKGIDVFLKELSDGIFDFVK